MMEVGQRVALVKMRSWQICRRRERRFTGQLSLLSAVLCGSLVCAALCFTDQSPGMVQGMSGATMLLENAGGYVLVGVICFVAAAAIAALCLQVKEKNNGAKGKIKEDKEQ